MPTKSTRVKVILGKDGTRTKVATTAGRRQSVSAKIAARKSTKARAVSPARARAAAAAPVAKLTSTPTHRDPKTGKTWSGRGRRPLWLKESHRI